MELTLGIMLYLNILFVGEEYHIEYIDQAEQEFYTEIQSVKQNTSEMQIVESQYVPQVETLVIYEYDDGGNVVIIDPQEKR